jgi:ATP-dependent Lhr-like helicase
MGSIRPRRADRGAAVGRERHAADRPIGPHDRSTEPRIIVPKYRGDLVACAAVTRAMHDAQIEASRYPRNPLDVLAQQIVAMVAMEPWPVDALFAAVRAAAPFAELSRTIFDGVLDMLSGRYPSDDFADLRPRLTWDRLKNDVTAREGAKRVAVVNGGTIPDRGLYGVFLVGERGPARASASSTKRWCSRAASARPSCSAPRRGASRRSRTIACSSPRARAARQDAVLEGGQRRPAAGARAPHRRAGARAPADAAAGRDRAADDASRPRRARRREPRALPRRSGRATGAVPTIARSSSSACATSSATGASASSRRSAAASMRRGRWRSVERVRSEAGIDAETMWTDDGFVVRFPETEAPPDPALMIPASDEAEALVVRQLGGTALFAAKFREAAARALLLPRRRPGGRTPLWQQRKRAADLLAVAATFGSFPMILEAYREVLRDVFDIPALVDTLRSLERRDIRTVTVDSTTPSPFASALLFGYVANYIYDGDAPLAERRAQALAIDQAQLRELLGEAELRELLDADALADVEAQLQQLDQRYRARSTDAVHDLLLHLGDLTRDEMSARSAVSIDLALETLERERRVLAVGAGDARYIPVEYAARYRDALGVPLPPGLPDALLEPSRDAALDLARRYARTHGPFTTAEFADRYALGRAMADALLKTLAAGGRLIDGEFRPGGTGREWCDPDVLQTIRRRSLAKLRKEVEPVDSAVLARLVTAWQGVTRPRAVSDALLDVIENLQGAPLPASILESEILAARLDGYAPADLDALAAAGEVIWRGVEPVGDRDGRVALYLTDHLPQLWRPPAAAELSAREQAVSDHLRRQGASFFAAVHDAAGGGYPGESVDALWDLVWKGLVTNDTFHALRAFTRAPERRTRKKGRQPVSSFRSRRVAPPSAEGRWSLLADRVPGRVTDTQWSAAMAQQLLARYGVLTREVAAAEGIAGGFGAIYDVLKALEDAGRIRRGYFAGGVAATQFALPAALDLLRSLRDAPEGPEVVTLAATDPANPYGTTLKWPAAAAMDEDSAGRAPTRTVGALVILVNGALAAYLPRGGQQLVVYLPEDEPVAIVDRSGARRRAGGARARRAPQRTARHRGERARIPRGIPSRRS